MTRLSLAYIWMHQCGDAATDTEQAMKISECIKVAAVAAKSGLLRKPKEFKSSFTWAQSLAANNPMVLSESESNDESESEEEDDDEDDDDSDDADEEADEESD